uniref:Uncharacterized protein n=1 Tax=Siphoviridae sp. ctkV91 TaxID=2827924 RepID=A0A8S5TDC4_9CAUD|nr:MAG TPA: hypothetical protein [Siphoviridae sp. ctkV91]DAQ10887.1 MAG TPA: hypothetical protein [Caudoviricetes sp.]
MILSSSSSFLRRSSSIVDPESSLDVRSFSNSAKLLLARDSHLRASAFQSVPGDLPSPSFFN